MKRDEIGGGRRIENPGAPQPGCRQLLRSGVVADSADGAVGESLGGEFDLRAGTRLLGDIGRRSIIGH